MRHPILHPLLLAAALSCGVLPTFGQAPLTRQADRQSTDIVSAAQTFLANLSATQRDAVMFSFGDDAQRSRWHNFPEGTFRRAGLAWGDIDANQQSILIKLLGTVLSPTGMTMVEEQMLADDLLGREGSQYGSDNYHVSFLGEPSTTAPWMLQFGGHHLALNATVVGPDVTLSPLLTGGQPVRFTINGREVDIVAAELAAATALLSSLTGQQRDQAILGSQAIGPLLGAGRDGVTLPQQGVLGSALSQSQRQQLLTLIQSRLGVLNADDFAATMVPIEANLDQTAFAWFGSTSDPATASWRVTGPTVVLEFSPQSRDGDAANHLHNIYRDPTNDYGALWTALD